MLHTMKRLYWLIQSIFNPVYSDEYRQYGEGEYLARHGVANEVSEKFNMIEGNAVIKLDKHLKHI